MKRGEMGRGNKTRAIVVYSVPFGEVALAHRHGGGFQLLGLLALVSALFAAQDQVLCKAAHDHRAVESPFASCCSGGACGEADPSCIAPPIESGSLCACPAATSCTDVHLKMPPLASSLRRGDELAPLPAPLVQDAPQIFALPALHTDGPIRPPPELIGHTSTLRI